MLKEDFRFTNIDFYSIIHNINKRGTRMIEDEDLTEDEETGCDGCCDGCQGHSDAEEQDDSDTE